MKFHGAAVELPNGETTSTDIPKHVFQVAVVLILLTILPLCINRNNPRSPLPSPKIEDDHGLIRSRGFDKKCDIFTGNWIPFPEGPYYTTATCNLMIDQQNCMKFGRPDTEFLKWRWKPDECELPLFDALQFLELVRGKSIAFVGDSVGRNQMQSLLCLLASVSTAQSFSGEVSVRKEKLKQTSTCS